MNCFGAFRRYLQERSRRREERARSRQSAALSQGEANRAQWKWPDVEPTDNEMSFKLVKTRLSLKQRRYLNYEQEKRQKEFILKKQEKPKERYMHGKDILDIYHAMKADEIARRQAAYGAFNERDLEIMHKMASYFEATQHVKASLEGGEAVAAMKEGDDGEDVGFAMFFRL